MRISKAYLRNIVETEMRSQKNSEVKPLDQMAPGGTFFEILTGYLDGPEGAKSFCQTLRESGEFYEGLIETIATFNLDPQSGDHIIKAHDHLLGARKKKDGSTPKGSPFAQDSVNDLTQYMREGKRITKKDGIKDMKLTKSYLRKIINEEISNVLKETGERGRDLDVDALEISPEAIELLRGNGYRNGLLAFNRQAMNTAPDWKARGTWDQGDVFKRAAEDVTKYLKNKVPGIDTEKAYGLVHNLIKAGNYYDITGDGAPEKQTIRNPKDPNYLGLLLLIDKALKKASR